MSEKHQLVCVAPDKIGEIWPFVEGMIDTAYAAYDEHPPENLRTWLADQRGLLWVSIEQERIVACLVTSLEPRRGGLVCRMTACGGSRMDLWKHCHQQIEDYARTEGCYKVVSEGRPGWARVLHGYKPYRTALEKRL